MKHRIGIIAPALALGACTSLSTTADVRTTNPSRAVAGIPYSLPMAQFDIEVTRSIAQCFAPLPDGKPDLNRPDVKFAIEVTATPRMVIGETYLIDPTELSGPTKTSSLTVTTHESGTLQSINASVEDRSAAIIGSVARVAIGGIGLAAGIPGTGGANAATEAQPMEIRCADGTQDRLAELDADTGAVARARAALKATSDRVTFLTEQASAGRLSEELRTELVAKLAEQVQQTRALNSALAEMDRAKSALSAKTRLRWPMNFFETDHNVPGLMANDLGRLAGLLKLVPVAGTVANTCSVVPAASADELSRALNGCLATQFGVMLGLQSLEPAAPRYAGTGDGEMPGAAIDTSSASEGIFIRPPARGRLIACRGQCANDTVFFVGEDMWIPQFGQLRLLPFRNEMFENSSLAVTLRADGSPSSIGYVQKAAQLEGVADAIEDVVVQAVAFDTLVRDDRAQRRAEAAAATAADRADQLAVLRQQIDVATLEAQLAAINRPAAAPSELDLARTQAELAAARATIAQAQLAERAALAALAALPSAP